MKVLVSTTTFGQVARAPLERLKAAGYEVALNPHGRTLTPEESIALLADVDGLVAGTERLDRRVLGNAPRLRAISRVGVGLDNIDLALAEEHGIAVFNTPEAHVDAVAELTLAGLLALLRRIPSADAAVRRGRWEKPMGGLLGARCVGIVGLGRVGRAVARLVSAFGARLLAAEPHPDQGFAQAHSIRIVALEELLAEADVVALHLPYGPETRHVIDGGALARMRPHALLVNTARGGLVDEEALAEFLRRHPQAGAFIDTFESEPYVGPLSDLENVVLTPHIGGYAREARLRMELEAVDNLLSHLQRPAAGRHAS